MAAEDLAGGEVGNGDVVVVRPWTVEELVREKGNRLDVVDAIAELDAAGLVTRINKRVVCASRATIHADRLSV